MTVVLADFGTVATGIAVLVTALITAYATVNNARKGPDERAMTAAKTRREEDLFYKDRLDTSEADLKEEEARRREAEERVGKLEADVARLRRSKDEGEVRARVEVRDAREAAQRERERSARLVAQLTALGATPVA